MEAPTVTADRPASIGAPGAPAAPAARLEPPGF